MAGTGEASRRKLPVPAPADRGFAAVLLHPSSPTRLRGSLHDATETSLPPGASCPWGPQQNEGKQMVSLPRAGRGPWCVRQQHTALLSSPLLSEPRAGTPDFPT